MQYPKTCKEIKHANKILIWDKMLSHTCMGVPYKYTHMGRPIRVWANIRIWDRTVVIDSKLTWKEHIKQVLSKSNASLAFLRCNLRACSRNIKPGTLLQ